ncbi:MAG TPA: cytochrome P460 family protein [Bryobacteraceae bacterium]|nr:cytochrome P460 family protein [Bryobacteraceae bacterium]
MQRPLKQIALAVAAIGMITIRGADRPASDAPQYTSEGRLRFPQNYREWVFLSSGLGMTYGPLGSAAEPRFDNVFVNPSAYRTFLSTGHWPDNTVLVLEVRDAQSKGSINRDGHFQGEVVGLEAHVRDEKRFPRKWAFFGFREKSEVSEAAAAETSSCFTCHEPNGAVDTTFVQFYPTLIPIARSKGTLKATP